MIKLISASLITTETFANMKNIHPINVRKSMMQKKQKCHKGISCQNVLKLMFNNKREKYKGRRRQAGMKVLSTKYHRKKNYT